MAPRYSGADVTLRRTVALALTLSASLITGLGANAVTISAAAESRIATTVPRTAAAPPLGDTVAAHRVYSGYGVSAHPKRQGSTYGNVDAWVQRLASAGVPYFRGTYEPGAAGMAETIAASRKYGVRWLMTVVPEAGTKPTHQTPTETRAVVQHIAREAADVVHAIEGLNEPNHNRGGGTVPEDWARIATAHQRAIWETAKSTPALSRVPILGPSLQTVAAEDSYDPAVTDPIGGPRHFHQLEDAGILAYQRWAGLHSYPDGRTPAYGLANRLRLIDSAYGADYPVRITEWGYHNAVRTTAGHDPVPEWVSATYGSRALLAMTTGERKVRLVRYEALDDVDAGVKDQHEANFGLWRVGSNDPATWTPKAEVGVMRGILAALRDPGPAYTPEPVNLSVSGPRDLRYVVTRTRDGAATLWVWRSLSVWDAAARKALSVPTTSVTVTDSVGARTIDVGPRVRALALRVGG